MTALQSVLTAVTDWVPRSEAQSRTRADFLDRLAAGSPVLARAPLATHVTASLFLFDLSMGRVLLCHHRKGDFWVQPGGHLEPEDRTIEGAAIREAVEETGLPREVIASVVMVDLDHHALNAGFGRCRSHLDVGFAGTADPDVPLVLSAESRDLQWFRVDDLPANLAPGLGARLGQILDRLDPTRGPIT